MDYPGLLANFLDSENPGTLCLRAMAGWRSTAAACDSHAHSLHPDHHYQPGVGPMSNPDQDPLLPR